MTTSLIKPADWTNTNDESEAWHTAAWMEHAACRTDDLDPELWFSHDKEDELSALAVCRMCPVVESCLADAMHQEGGRRPEARHGVWGGLRPNERHNLRMRRLREERGGAS